MIVSPVSSPRGLKLYSMSYPGLVVADVPPVYATILRCCLSVPVEINTVPYYKRNQMSFPGHLLFASGELISASLIAPSLALFFPAATVHPSKPPGHEYWLPVALPGGQNVSVPVIARVIVAVIV